MDFNTLLLRLGLDPTNFVNRLNEPIKTSTGFIYEVDQNVTVPLVIELIVSFVLPSRFSPIFCLFLLAFFTSFLTLFYSYKCLNKC